MLTKIQNAGRLKRAALAFGAGAAGSLGMAPHYWWPALIFSLSAFYLLINRTGSARGAFVYGWLFAFGYFFTGLFWVKNALLVDGNPFSWIWPLAVAGLPSLLAVFIAFGVCGAKKFSDLKTVSGFLSFCAFVGIAEWARSFVFTGYPWNLFGYAWAGWLPMIQNVAIGNIFFLSWLSVIWFSLPGFLLLRANDKKYDYALAGTCALIFLLCLAFGYWRLATTTVGAVPDIKIHVVQPNIPQAEKWNPNLSGAHFLKAVNLSMPADGEENQRTIIVWPETAISYRFTQDPTAMKILTDMLKSYDAGAVLLTGLLRFEAETHSYYNSLVMIDAAGNISNIYDKHHLVPFGEYIPFQKWIPLKPVVEFTGFVLGDGAKTFNALGIKYSPVICYEIIFPGRITAQDMPQAIVNITNDAWYGISAGPYQHFDQAIVRAVEEGTPVIRAANTGFSGIIDPLGHVIEKSMLFQEYEKTLDLPSQSVIFRNYRNIKDVIFTGLMLLFASLGYLQHPNRNK